jgi:hypothetical protein
VVHGGHPDRPSQIWLLRQHAAADRQGVSEAYREFLVASGLGLLIGDGKLDYSTERILETYYAFAINKSFTFRRLSTHRKSRLQRRPRTRLYRLMPFARRVLNKALS